MKSLAWMGMALLLLVGCGDSNDNGGARTANGLCDEVCGWPDSCFAELGVPMQGDCMESCTASVDVVGIACLGAIADTISCLGTCDLNDLTEEQVLACQDEALRISDTCE